MSSIGRETRDPANVKVICLGLGRTGTTSLSEALEILGFGPCYHTFRLVGQGKLDLYPWIKMAKKESATPEDLDRVLEDYCSVLDEPPALFPEGLYNAYPNAKFILTTRDPDSWERSMKDTILAGMRLGFEMVDPQIERHKAFIEWYKCALKFNPELFCDTKAVLFRHNARVKSIIPPEQLLIFEVSEGWDKLVNFLEVSKPDVPFPHLNDTEYFKKTALQS